MKNIKIRFFYFMPLSVSNRIYIRIRPNRKSKNGYRLACFHAKTRFDLGNIARILV